MSLSKTAQAYAEKAGWYIHPVRRNKVAILSDWPNAASNDVEIIDKMWSQHPDASIGVVCGPKSGIWVLDLDLPNGIENLNALEKKYGELPVTLTQQTGSGGRQFFWRWNGHPVRNSSGKIAENIDVRGDGGYVVVPPSGHPSGNKYKWLNKAEVALAPEWLVKLAMKRKDGAHHNSYGQTALSNELAKLARASIHERNDTLNLCSYSLGQLVAGGELEYGSVAAALLGVALSIGLGEKESRKTIESGMRGGALRPRKGKFGSESDALTIEDINRVDSVDSVDTCRHLRTVEDTSRQSVDTLWTSCRQSVDSGDDSLANRIYDWILNSPGSFTNSDIDREFCLSTRLEKKNRSVILARLYGKQYIKKNKRKKGHWYVVDQDIEFIDLDAEEPESFPIKLPFGIHEYVKIPPKAVILLAGSSNAGKTAFVLNTLRENLNQAYGKLYLMSEMGGGEYRTRIKGFGDGLGPWKKIRAASKSYDFDGAIQAHNKDGLTCIDYLEEAEGEYFKIPTDIRNIYDSLGDGVAIIAIQKRTDQDYARGGQGTVEKARLVMNLDYLATGDRCIYCSLKLVKVKHFLERNLQNHEIHFKLEMGCHITPITDWMLSPKVNRKKYIAQYEAGNDNPSGLDLYFKTKNGTNRRIVARDIQRWQEEMPNIDVYAELSKIVTDSVRNPFLSDKKYFFQIATMLREKNEAKK